MSKTILIFIVLLLFCFAYYIKVQADITSNNKDAIEQLPRFSRPDKNNYSAQYPSPFINRNDHLSADQNIKIVTINHQQLISFDCNEIKVQTLLKQLAQSVGINMIVSDRVTGDVTLHFDKIPWQQALDVILQDQGLVKRCIGNVYLIAPIEEIADHEQENLQVEQKIAELAPLQSELIQIKYGKAADIVAMLKGQSTSLLTSRGNVSADIRTNTIWIEDVPQKITELHHLIKQLDMPVNQVLIEARIVNIDCNFEHELGVRFGVTSSNHISGTIAGANQIANQVKPADVPISQRLNMDLPAIALSGTSPVSFGLALAHIGKDTLLDLELSALESEGGGQVISRPHLITSDQQAAQILAGEEIPYQQSTSSGATNVSFKDVVLKLNVTPQITPQGKIMLTLKVNQDKVGNRIVLGTPSIDTREMETQVLVESGETVVLGGIYETDNRNLVQRVPFLSSIPILGNLFRYNRISSQRQELLIFVTPHILLAGEEGI